MRRVTKWPVLPASQLPIAACTFKGRLTVFHKTMPAPRYFSPKYRAHVSTRVPTQHVLLCTCDTTCNHTKPLPDTTIPCREGHK